MSIIRNSKQLSMEEESKGLERFQKKPLNEIFVKSQNQIQLTEYAKSLLSKSLTEEMVFLYKKQKEEGERVLKQQKDKEEKARLKILELEKKKDEEIKKKIMAILPEFLTDLLEEEETPNKFENIFGKTDNISGFLPLRDNANEFKGNPEIKNTIMSLAKNKPLYRKIRGDGNCFYRAAVIQYFEKLLEEEIVLDKKKINSSKIIKFVIEVYKSDLIICKNEGNNRDLIDFLQDINNMKYVLNRNIAEILFHKFYFEEKYPNKKEAYKKLLDLIQEKLNTKPGLDVSLIVFLRSFILKKYKENFSIYKDFIFDNEAENVLSKFGTEGENLIIPLAADALEANVVINMVHTDRKNNKITLLVDKYEGHLSGQKKKFDIQMYFKPGHYDCLYEREFYGKYIEDQADFKDL